MYGQNWKRVAKEVGTKTLEQCRSKGYFIFNRKSGIENKPDPELIKILKPVRDKVLFNNEEQHAWNNAVLKYGRDWNRVAQEVKTKNIAQCEHRAKTAVVHHKKWIVRYPDVYM